MQDLQSIIRDAVFAAIDELNEQRAPHERLTKALDGRLAGDDSPLDSLAFVNLIVGVEQRLDGVLGTPVSLLDDERLDPTDASFSTVGSFITYLESLLRKADV